MAGWDDVRRISLALPETSEGVSHGGVAAWRVRTKLFVWERPLRRADLEALGDAAPDGPILGVRVPDVGVKDALLGENPDVYLTTPHFDGFPAILVRLDRISGEELEEIITEAWLTRAPKRLASSYLADSDADRVSGHTASVSGHVVAVHVSPSHSFSKSTVESIRLLEGLGVEGDAHAGATVKHRSRVAADPSQPNLRQVHLIHAELFDRLRGIGHVVNPGELGENVTTRGIELLDLPVGTRLRVGESVIVVTGLRNPCRQINDFQDGLLKQVIRKRDDGTVERLSGVMGIVARSGRIAPGDSIRVELPPQPHLPLTLV